MSNQTTPYWQKLQDPRWQRKRLEVFERDNFTCRSCGATDKQLEVHHIYYVSGREYWDYPLHAFKTLCRSCHESAKVDNATNCEDWEHFVGLEEESDERIECPSGFIPALLLLSHNSGLPACEVLALMAHAMDTCVIDQETLVNWKNELQKKRNPASINEAK